MVWLVWCGCMVPCVCVLRWCNYTMRCWALRRIYMIWWYTRSHHHRSAHNRGTDGEEGWGGGGGGEGGEECYRWKRFKRKEEESSQRTCIGVVGKSRNNCIRRVAIRHTIMSGRPDPIITQLLLAWVSDWLMAGGDQLMKECRPIFSSNSNANGRQACIAEAWLVG